MSFCGAEGWAVFSDRRAMDFTLCFQDSVLTVFPNVVLLLFFSPRMLILKDKGRLQGVKAGVVFPLKMVAVVAAMAIQAALLAKTVSADAYPTSIVLSTAMYLVASIAAGLLHYFEHYNMANPSTTLLSYWLVTALFAIFPARSWIQESPNGPADTEALLKLIFAIVAGLAFVLENIPKPNRASLTRPGQEPVVQSNPSPEPSSSIFARMTFFWLLPLLNKGRKKTLRMDDLWSVHPKLLSFPLYLTTKAKMEADEAIARQKLADEKAADLGDDKVERNKNHIHLFSTVMHTVGWTFMMAIGPRLLFIAALYVRPILFSNLISFVNSYSPESSVAPQVPWIGFGLLLAVLASGVLSCLFDAQFQYICFNAGLKARGVFVNLIYRKSLRLSTTAKQEGMGAIVNHMSTDVDKVVSLFRLFHYFWSALVEVPITILLLYVEVKYAIFASIGVVIVIIAIAGACSPSIAKANKANMKASDMRMQLVTELVTYIKSIKLYAWEPYFANKISLVRQEQLKQLRRFFSWLTFVAVWMNMITPLSIFATLSIYSTMATPEAPLDIRRIFTTITLINMLEEPIGFLSDSLSAIVNGKVAYDRLKNFLNSEEIDAENVIRDEDMNASELAYEINDGTFGWYSPQAIEAMNKKREEDAAKKAKEEAAKAKKASKNKTKDIPESSSTLEAVPSEKTPMDEKNADSDEPSRDNTGPALFDINLKIKRGALTAVVGRVGEGKSSLVGAMLGEMHRYSGTVKAFGSLAYVAQSAWILNDTVRNNILFGRPYDKERYFETIKACALAPDFKMLVNGDKTVIGEKGINLSGGQKQRISIARAVYANADVYIFDDPLSAVDAHVDHLIFNQAICTILAEKTRILITNGVNHLPSVDQIVVLKEGRIAQDGKYTDLIQDEQGSLFRLIQESKVVASTDSEKESEDKEPKEWSASESSDASDTDDDKVAEAADPSATSTTKATRPAMKRNKSSKVNAEDLDLEEADDVDEEISSKGRVGWSVYKFYLQTIGTLGVVVFVGISLFFLVTNIMTQLWLQWWGQGTALALATNTEPEHSDTYWIVTYFVWVLAGMALLTFSIGYSMLVMAQRGSKKLHAAMLGPLIRSAMSFFDVTSSGKIVNRFAHDILAVDNDLPLQFLNLLFIIQSTAMIFAFCVAATPYFAIIMIPLGFCYYFLGGFFLVSSRELKRLDSAAHSPLYAHFGETLSGLVTIRAFQDKDRFAIQATDLLDRSQQTSYLANATQRWLQVMLDTLSVLILCIISLLAILQRNSVQAGLFSIVLSQIGVLTIIMSRLLTVTCMVETSIVAVERIREYSQLTPEARDVIPDSKTDPEWPQKGEISFQGYSTRYREGLDLVLRNVDLTIRGGERVGIVGRTGAGKSSVTLALFRLIEAAEGSIVIDGIDISTLGLQELRSRLTIIPQDPFLFGASIRSNLDPMDKHTDAEIWSALESASLKAYVSSLTESLSTTIENGGENMSLGQRQLMSLARAMLAKNTRVLCLDEATAAIDIETDNAIQRALRREFGNCTVLTIAHRINTIMDSDRILVLDHGQVAEFDSPKVLLENKDSHFYGLALQSGNI